MSESRGASGRAAIADFPGGMATLRAA